MQIDQPVVRVVERKSLGDGLDRLAELSLGAPGVGLGALALLFQPVALDETIAQHRQCPRHTADLVSPGPWDGTSSRPCVMALMLRSSSTQRSVDGTHDERRDAQRKSESDDAAGYRQIDRASGIAH